MSLNCGEIHVCSLKSMRVGRSYKLNAGFTWFNQDSCLITQGTIRDAIEDSITWPVRKVIPILPGDYRYSRIMTFQTC